MADNAVEHPTHYNEHPSGIECIDVIKHMSFPVGSVIKYLWRHGLKPGEPALRDLKKARQYLDFLIQDEEEREAAKDAEVRRSLDLLKVKDDFSECGIDCFHRNEHCASTEECIKFIRGETDVDPKNEEALEALRLHALLRVDDFSQCGDICTTSFRHQSHNPECITHTPSPSVQYEKAIAPPVTPGYEKDRTENG